MSEKKFSKKHEWVSLDGDVATVGITKHATEMLGDIVFVEVPDAGKAVEKEGQAAVVESTLKLRVMFILLFLEKLQREIKLLQMTPGAWILTLKVRAGFLS